MIQETSENKGKNAIDRRMSRPAANVLRITASSGPRYVQRSCLSQSSIHDCLFHLQHLKTGPSMYDFSVMENNESSGFEAAIDYDFFTP